MCLVGGWVGRWVGQLFGWVLWCFIGCLSDIPQLVSMMMRKRCFSRKHTLHSFFSSSINLSNVIQIDKTFWLGAGSAREIEGGAIVQDLF